MTNTSTHPRGLFVRHTTKVISVAHLPLPESPSEDCARCGLESKAAIYLFGSRRFVFV